MDKTTTGKAVALEKHFANLRACFNELTRASGLCYEHGNLMMGSSPINFDNIMIVHVTRERLLESIK